MGERLSFGITLVLVIEVMKGTAASFVPVPCGAWEGSGFGKVLGIRVFLGTSGFPRVIKFSTRPREICDCFEYC